MNRPLASFVSIKIGLAFSLFLLVMLPKSLQAQSLEDLKKSVGTLYAEGDLKGVIAICEKEITKWENNPQKEDEGYQQLFRLLGALYAENDDYRQSERTYLRLLDFQLKKFGEKSIRLAKTLEYLAEANFNLNEYKNAESYFDQAIRVYRINRSDTTRGYFSLIESKALLYRYMGYYGESEKLYTDALTYFKRNEPGGVAYLGVISDLATLCMFKGDLSSAEKYYLEAINLHLKFEEPDLKNYVSVLNNLAALYAQSNNVTKAESIFRDVIDLRKEIYGDAHPEYAGALINLALTYTNSGKYAEVEDLYLKAQTIYRGSTGEQDPNYIRLLTNFAAYYERFGNYEKAKSLLELNLSIGKKIYGDVHPEIAKVLNDLAEVYEELDSTHLAKKYFTQAKDVAERSVGKENPVYASVIWAYANFLLHHGDAPNAILFFSELIDRSEKMYGPASLYYAIHLCNLARAYVIVDRYMEAKQLYEKALTIITGPKHDIQAVSKEIHLNGGVLYEYLNDALNTNFHYSQFIRKEILYWRSTLSFLSSKESTEFINSKYYLLGYPASFLFRHPLDSIKSDLFDFNLMIKGALLRNDRSLTQSVARSTDKGIKSKWEQYRYLQRLISTKMNSTDTAISAVPTLMTQAEMLEKELMRGVPGFKESVLGSRVSWKEVQSELSAGDAAIDFIRYEYHDSRWTDTVMYGAFVIRPGWKQPLFLNLCREDELLQLLGTRRASTDIDQLYRGLKPTALDSAGEQTISRLLWDPIDTALVGVKRLFLSPVGLLHRLSFAAIITPSGERVIDRFDLATLSNIRHIAESNMDTLIHPSSILLFGGIDYDTEPLSGKETYASPENTEANVQLLRPIKEQSWPFLPGTKKEIVSIGQIAAVVKLPVVAVSGANASEERLMQMASAQKDSFFVMHIATHGFAFSRSTTAHRRGYPESGETKQSLFRRAEDPLARTGLVLAGANKTWEAGQSAGVRTDGILTAREVSNLDLQHCLLATLSACETGLGEVKEGEEVFGLQRGFKMAGVRYLITSLWEIPDAETAEFMQLFYTNWLKNKLSIRKAFRASQLSLRKKYSSYKWAAFVLIE